MRCAVALLLLLAACSKSADVYEELPNSSLAGAAREDVPESRLDSALARPVMIGEDGSRFDACGTMGQVSRPGAKGLALRAAPFAEAKETGRLAEGARLFVCTRSLDQKWLGVVVVPPPAAAPPGLPAVAQPAIDCEVSSPVERRQAYAGPCPSGWVASAYVRLIAG
jgi:hypothetical protein